MLSLNIRNQLRFDTKGWFILVLHNVCGVRTLKSQLVKIQIKQTWAFNFWQIKGETIRIFDEAPSRALSLQQHQALISNMFWQMTDDSLSEIESHSQPASVPLMTRPVSCVLTHNNFLYDLIYITTAGNCSDGDCVLTTLSITLVAIAPNLF